MTRIANIVIYTGHHAKEVLGPYAENIQKRFTMFTRMNSYRSELERKPWNIIKTTGEELIQTLSSLNHRKTLLVIPAGQSTHLDKVFTVAETSFLQSEFFENGGRIYVNCGSAYWSSRRRIYDDVCLEQPENPMTLIKESNFPLFEGTAIGPLCPYPGIKYKVGFFSDAIEVTSGTENCTIFLSGGGSFILPQNAKQEIKVLLRYTEKELQRHEKTNTKKWENAAILTKVGNGAALMSMFHPYYSPRDIDTERYESAFPDCGTNWQAIHDRLTPEEERIPFIFKWMLQPLEDFDT